MDGAYLYYEAFDVMRSRLAAFLPRSVLVTAHGAGLRADLGSSSIFRNILRRVHPLYRRRLCDAYVKGENVLIHSSGCDMATLVMTALRAAV